MAKSKRKARAVPVVEPEPEILQFATEVAAALDPEFEEKDGKVVDLEVLHQHIRDHQRMAVSDQWRGMAVRVHDLEKLIGA